MTGVLKQYIGNVWQPVVVGAAGPQGSTGATGPAGASGPQGASGPTGPAGPIAGSNTQIIFNDSGNSAGSAGLTFDKTSNTVTVTGQVTTPNIQNGTANIAIGNLVLYTQDAITNTDAFQPNVSPNPGAIRVGSGNAGSWTTADDIPQTGRNGRLWILDRIAKGNDGVRNSELGSQIMVDAQGANWTNSNSRAFGISGELAIGNITGTTNAFQLAGIRSIVSLGNNYGLGNATIGTASSILASWNLGSGATITNMLGYLHSIFQTTGSITNVIGYVNNGGGTITPSGAYIGFYHAGSTNTYGVSNNNSMRAAPTYYAFKNDDDAAQVGLGSLRNFHEFRTDVSISSGAITIDADAAQVQYVSVTANITSVTFSNFVRTASDGTNTDQQVDTVTVIFRQDATGRSITLPTGAGYRYAGSQNIMGSTANAVQMMSVTAITDAAGTGTEYLITVSPEFV